MFAKDNRTVSVVTGLVVVAGLLLSACSTAPGSQTESSASSSGGQPDQFVATDGKLDVTLTAAETMVPYRGSERWAMTYNGKVTGPTLVIHPGDRVTVNLVNDLKQATSLHTHGLHVSPEQDNPFTMVEPGKTLTLTYDIPLNQQTGTFWYHPHIHGITAEQVASGLSGAIIVEDQVDRQLSKVTTNRVLVINDPPLTNMNPWADAAGSDSNDTSGMGGMDMGGNSSSGVDMMTVMMGRSGPRLLTNGLDGISLSDGSGKLERLHIVNATASTRLQFSYSGAKMLILASEGGRLPAPVEVTTFTLAPSERAELVLIPGAGGGLLSAQRLSSEAGGSNVGSPSVIASIADDAGSDLTALPTSLFANATNLFSFGVKVAKQREVTLVGHMNPTFDGQPFDPNVVNFTAKKGTVEEWVIRNTTPMYHPIHLHTWGIQVKGEQGWQDVVTVPPNSERVIRVSFGDFAGTTVLHCHILDHEDAGMMAVIKVE